ncbi:MAG: HopJ type III effector protein [Bacteroidetes bacterium]|nr:HopJ type III effector protein [Bacteroidota bacterium]MBU1373428.1 HopJ type III effector protein [Bacteroidota bacterium]MBU1484156.1 HopJ type III effector protein [Bacteroidota bacterium]MBU1760001.1 HopJ type III effector protein [Bacteroidota bacterium]MBU2045127.1 HopJ type III effector protein [Bacteroidota bacterium]
MKNPAEKLLKDLKSNHLKFAAIIETIETSYQYNATAFKNGAAFNEIDQNQGSAKVFYFALLNNLSKEDTLLLFAEQDRCITVDKFSLPLFYDFGGFL